jgi:hypothetical protein
MANFYTIIDTLKNHLDNDAIVNTVTTGDIFQVDLGKQTIFPLAHIMVNSAVFEANVIRFNISLLAMDIVDISKDEVTEIFLGNDNEQDVLNTQLAILNRLYEILRRGDLYSDNFMVDGNPTCEPFAERFENYLSGWTMTFDILVANTMTICDSITTTAVYSQVIDFESTPMNSIRYLCDGDFITACYGTNQTNITDLVAMFNAENCFPDYGVYSDNGDGRVRLDIPTNLYNSICNGSLTLDVIYD